MPQSIDMLNKLRLYKSFSAFYTVHAMERAYVATDTVFTSPNVVIPGIYIF